MAGGLGGDLHGKTLAILGLGSIGQRSRNSGRCSACASSPGVKTSPPNAAEAGVTCQQAELFEQADMLSVHLVLSERSRGLVDAEALGWMKPSARLVNTARGPIVDEQALIKALQKRRWPGRRWMCALEPLPSTTRFAAWTMCWPHPMWGM
jgi:lactate dehydrogenase-like 2-hydroxyacid dehydrogenase